MTIKDKLSSDPGFQYIIDSIELMSAAGHRLLLQQTFSTQREQLEKEYDNTEKVIALLEKECNSSSIAVIRHQLMQMHDLQGTLLNLQRGQTLEEIELFEIKCFALLCIETNKAAKALAIEEMLAIPHLGDIFSLLDPDKTGIPNFYIYDSYHPDLPELRRNLKTKQALLDNCKPADPRIQELQREVNDLFDRQRIVQQEVIENLSKQLKPFQPLLLAAFDRMAYTDLILAKATLAQDWRLSRPTIVEEEETSSFEALWNPRLRHRNESQGRRYQPIDIDFKNGVCLITGANMAGKTVLLKTIGITHMLAQFGFFVPANKACLRLVDDVVFCIGDEQNEMNGLSSFASEIIKISDAIRLSDNKRLLILIDEPARTTNPTEGKAIVQAVATILDKRGSATLITTHYSQLGLGCRRLRVKGFVEEAANVPLTPENINNFMDYSLVPDQNDNVPQEALRIATILGCDSQMLETAYSFLVTVD